MSIVYKSLKRFQDLNEAVTYEALDSLAQGTAEIEPDTVRREHLVEEDIVQIISQIDTAFTGSVIHGTAIPVAAGTSALLNASGVAPDTATTDSVVTVDNRMTHNYLTGFIEFVPGTNGDLAPRVHFIAHNLGNASETVTNGQVINYAVHDGAVTEQPLSPNAQLTVTPGHRWLNAQGVPTFEPVTIGALNQTALPSIAIPDKVITELELNGTDLVRLGALYTGRRGVFSVPTDTSVPVGPAVLLGTITFTPSSSIKVVKVAAPFPAPIFTGYISSSNGTSIASLYARNNAASTITVKQFTQLRVLAY